MHDADDTGKYRCAAIKCVDREFIVSDGSNVVFPYVCEDLDRAKYTVAMVALEYCK